MAKIFTDILLKAKMSGITPDNRKWFHKQAKSLKVTPKQVMTQSSIRFRQSVYPGHLYFMYYDPKHKKTLPYYDLFPLFFPIDVQKDYILGINLHYLPYALRAKLMDALYGLANNTKMNQKTKLKISYGILKSAAKYKYFRPTIKKYLKKHIKSKFVTVHPNEWDIALFMPVEQFQKKSKTAVWKESRKIISRW